MAHDNCSFLEAGVMSARAERRSSPASLPLPAMATWSSLGERPSLSGPSSSRPATASSSTARAARRCCRSLVSIDMFMERAAPSRSYPLLYSFYVDGVCAVLLGPPLLIPV
ncbi:hypothetical protein GQ55_5G139500 [Panicum hallii var. hallii]|uniref:Uncharacterized protein n=1 Tax=Panicum hallii var. hallii TaxID=1504633 RepID=A0A2T7DG32_9POAL|nr:hypothetical protein GQ55_5G139500 [Panicum hallii var. hallii]